MAIDSKALAPVLNPIVTNIINPLIVTVFAFAILVFVYGVIQMVINEADSDAHKTGKISMISGVIGLFIMISAWGIINLVFNTVTTFR